MSVLTESERELDEPVAVTPLPDRYELIDGEVVEVEEMGFYSSEIANRLRDELHDYGKSKQVGRARMEVLYPIPTKDDPGRLRRPDAAFATFERWPMDHPVSFQGNPANFVPDLVVEVISPSDNGDDVVSKLNEYLRAGVRMVWLIWPNEQQLYSYTAPKAVRIFSAEDVLDGGDVLPGFQVPMASLFPIRADAKK